jgi:hypothetical protein
VRKRKPAAAALAPAPRKTLGKRGHVRRSIDSRTQTSALELALAKPMKRSNKFIVKSSGLSVAEKATAATIKTAADGSDVI